MFGIRAYCHTCMVDLGPALVPNVSACAAGEGSATKGFVRMHTAVIDLASDAIYNTCTMGACLVAMSFFGPYTKYCHINVHLRRTDAEEEYTTGASGSTPFRPTLHCIMEPDLEQPVPGRDL